MQDAMAEIGGIDTELECGRAALRLGVKTKNSQGDAG
jgi:hypothetical protein